MGFSCWFCSTFFSFFFLLLLHFLIFFFLLFDERIKSISINNSNCVCFDTWPWTMCRVINSTFIFEKLTGRPEKLWNSMKNVKKKWKITIICNDVLMFALRDSSYLNINQPNVDPISLDFLRQHFLHVGLFWWTYQEQQL